MTLRTTFKSLLVAVVFAVQVQAAESPFNGSWKINLSKSQLSGQTFSIQKSSGDLLHFEMSGYDYDFDWSGKEFATPDGGTVAVKSPDANTREFTFAMKGKTTAVYTLHLKGDEIDMKAKIIKGDKGPVDQDIKFLRASGGPGFLGKWKSTDVKGAATSVQFRVNGNNVSFGSSEFQAICDGKFDGKDYPVKIAGAASKQTNAFEKKSDHSIKVTTKLDGKPYYVDVFTVSADGKTLTDEGTPVSANEPVKAVYEK